MSDFADRLRSMSMEQMWTESRRRTGSCHACGNELKPGEDFAMCDACWDRMIPEQEED